MNKIHSLLQNDDQINAVLSQESILFIFILFSSYNYYFNLDLVWFTFSHLLLCIIMQILFILIIRYNANISHYLEREVNLKMIENQLRLRMGYHTRYKKDIFTVNDFKHSFRESVLTIESLFEQGNLTAIEKSLKKDLLPLLELLPTEKKYSNIDYVDAILFDWDSQCEENHIDFDGVIYLPDNFIKNETIFLSLLTTCKAFSIALASKRIGGKVKLGCKVVQNRFVLQIAASYHGSISSKKGLPYFDTTCGLDVKSSYHKLLNNLTLLNGDIVWENDRSSSLFKISLSFRQ